MKLLIDTDAFCKLGMAGLLDPAIEALGATGNCGRLPALPYMLRKGQLPRKYGREICTRLLPEAESIPNHPGPDPRWLDVLSDAREIDPGEAALFAAAATVGSLVLTGDKRAVLGLASAHPLHEALSGRIVAMEGILIRLCDVLGTETVGHCLRPLHEVDRMIGVCFSPGNADPRRALDSYFRRLTDEARPLPLWNPEPEGGP